MTKFTKREPIAALGYTRTADALLTTGQLVTVSACAQSARVEVNITAPESLLNLKFTAGQARAIAAEMLASAAHLDDQVKED